MQSTASSPNDSTPGEERLWLRGLGGVGVVVALGVGVWMAAGEPSVEPASSEQTVAHQRALSEVSGCLLTEPRGVAQRPASEVWAGMQEAASEAGVRVSFLPLSKAGTPADQLNALIAQRCTVVVAVGATPVAAVGRASVGPQTGVRFAAAGTSAGQNVRRFDATRDGARSAIAALFLEQRGEES